MLEHDFAVILLDVNMPGMDGLETAAFIRKRQRTAHTPIIFVTAYADEMHTARGYSLGAVDYILAPIIPEVLRSKVKVFVQLQRMAQQIQRQAAERVALAREQAARTAAEEVDTSVQLPGAAQRSAGAVDGPGGPRQGAGAVRGAVPGGSRCLGAGRRAWPHPRNADRMDGSGSAV